MSNKKQVESLAIVLECRDHGESDLIVTFFCQDHGRLTGIAKGAKRSKKRFVNKLEIFSSLRILHTIPQGNRLAFISEADLLESYLGLRTDISCYSTASVIRECTLLATKEVEGDQELYPLLLWAFTCLDQGRPSLPTLIFFLIRFFVIIGYGPQLHRCLGCHQELKPERHYSFALGSNGIHCNKCASLMTSKRLKLSQGTLRTLTGALSRPLDRLKRLILSPNSQQESLDFLHCYGRQIFQRDIVSWSSLNHAQDGKRPPYGL